MKITDLDFDHLPEIQRWVLASIVSVSMEKSGDTRQLPDTIEILVGGQEVTLDATAHVAEAIHAHSEASYQEGFENGLAEAEYRIKDAVSKLLSGG